MASNRSGHVYQYPDAGAGGAGGGAAAAAAAAGGGGQQAAFADSASARTFLGDYVNDADFLKAVPDEKVVPWATHVKSKVDGFGNQFPEKWRNLIAGDNAEHLKTLERFQSPKALYDSYGALRQKMSSGELRAVTAFPDKGTPEEQTAWRTANGIPDKPEAYNVKFGEGLTVGEDDKPVIESLKKAAHANHMSPAHLNATASWFLQEKATRAEARATKDDEFRAQAEDALRTEWQTDYRGNVARIGALLDMAPKGVKEAISGARLADGTPMGNHPDVLRFLVDLSRQVNPAGVVLPGAGGNMSQSVEDEIKGIETTMRENRSKYDKDEKMQARLRELYTARDKLQGGSKKAA